MELIIKQHKTSIFRNKYSIFENGNLIFTAKLNVFSEPKQLDLIDLNNNIVCSIEKEISIFPEFNMVFNGGSYLKCEGQRQPHNYLTIRTSEGTFEAHHQKGLRIAIFKNEEQIAIIKRDRFHFLNAGGYTIISNSDIVREFIILLCLGWDFTNNDKLVIFPIYLGRLGLVKRKEIIDWKPIK